jgi:penicillin-binding protein 2
MFNKRKKRKYHAVDPDEIFLDSKNLPNFNTQQFEGRLEKAIPKKTFVVLSVFLSVIGVVFLYQLGVLQITKGEAYLKRSEDNTLSSLPVFAGRGIIYDRNKVKLAWNTWPSATEVQSSQIPDRVYIGDNGFAHLLGYVSYPAKDKSGNYWQDKFIGKDGIEKFYDTQLTGKNGTRITELDVKGKIQSENIVVPPVHGDDMTLSIDSRIQNKLYGSIASMAKNASFTGGAGVFMDINNGEILAITSYPEYNSNILSKGKDAKIIKGYLSDSRKVFLNRNVNGLYSPGSIVKPFVGYGALVENIISPNKVILSNGSISIPNPYFPEKKSIFKDHGVFGYVNMAKAIAVSSDVYFYAIGGGYQDQKGLGILNIDKYIQEFGISLKTGIDLAGEKEGVIPTPEWKALKFKGDLWRVGDTYNSSIGQYGFQVTPLQMVRAVAAIANEGTLLTPHLVAGDKFRESQKTKLPINQDAMKVVKEGMRMAVTEGTATALNIKDIKVAAKSGTAQIGLGNTNTNSWIIGFFPYENPKYAFAVLMERGPKEASGNATRVASEVIDFMKLNTPDYLK